MENCEFYRNLLEKLIADQISEPENDLLIKHLKTCKECSELFDAHTVLTKSASPFEDLNADDLQMMRRNVLNSIQKKQEKSILNILQKYLDYLRVFIKRPELAFAAIALMLGFFLGRVLPPDENGITGGIVRQINNIAKQNIHFTDTQNSSYQYSNVSMKEIDDQNIALSFDVTTHLDVTREKKDPLVREIIAQTLMNPEGLGSRLKAISYTESILDNKIKDALIFSMQRAPLPAIRLKAMSSLMNYKNDPQVQEAFIKVLNEEKTIKMNLMAIDYLTDSNFNADTLKSVLSEIDPQKSSAVFIRAKEYIENK
ncbi:zf-HC2 domain-containing protein [Calditrichota bacterium]